MAADDLVEIQARLATLGAAADEFDFPAMAEAVVELLWAVSEYREDFEELPALIVEYGERLSHAADDLDVAQFCTDLAAIFHSLAERHATKAARKYVAGLMLDLAEPAGELDAPKIVLLIGRLVESVANSESAPRRLPVVLEGDRIRIGRHFTVRFRRTLRIPEDGKGYPLPPGFKAFPICKVEDYADKVPAHWLEEGGFFIPMHQREALYLEFGGAKWRPAVVKVGVGKINAITGNPWDEKIRKHKQDYALIPEQKWLDGINSEDGRVRQFVAMPLGEGYTVEEQITDEARFGGIQIVAFDPKPGVFPEDDPSIVSRRSRTLKLHASPTSIKGRGEMGIGAGGKIKQKIVEDYYGANSWDEDSRGIVYVRIVNSVMVEQITGMKVPASPISAKQYTDAGLPWFDYYDEIMPAVLPSGILAGVQPVGALDKVKGKVQHEDQEPVRISPDQLRRIAVPSKDERLTFLCKSALACFGAKRFDLAKRNADFIIELNPKDVLALRIRAECYLHFRKWEHAEADASDCLELDSENSFTWRTRAKAHLRLGEYEQAAKDASESLQRHPDNAPALNIRAEAYLLMKSYDGAISDCSAVLTFDGRHDGALRIRAEAYRMTGKYAESVADATAALNLHPTSVYALETRAESFRKLGNCFDGRRDAEEALRLDPGNNFAEGVLERIRTG